MSKLVQQRSRMSRIRRSVIITMVLSALVLVPAVVMAQSSQTTHFKVTLDFNGKNGGYTQTGVIMDKAGNVYNAATAGGDLSCNPPYGCGNISKVDSSGKQTVLYKFCSLKNCADGGSPDTTMVQDAAGNLFGGTSEGGAYGFGTVFKLTPSGKYTVLWAFHGGKDGGVPFFGALLLDKAGNLYGTTYRGGDLSCPEDVGIGCGVVFKVDPKGKETVLHSFTGGKDGNRPFGLVQDEAGNFYGSTYHGGDLTCNAPEGCGNVFKIDTNGKLRVLHSFVGGENDGASPAYGASVILDSQGNVYGTTVTGGNQTCANYPPGGCGTVYKVDPNGKETILHFFYPSAGDGIYPFSPVELDSSGNLYGTTLYGGNYQQYPCGGAGLGCGIVFKIDPNGTETILHGFTGGKDGGHPYAGVLLDANNNVYGAAEVGGNSATKCPEFGPGCGVLFKITQ
jgi:uncharacterized repeat protein (TIGR03803 family)